MIPTYGLVDVALTTTENKILHWTFVIAEVTVAIIGVDFIYTYDFIIDIKQKNINQRGSGYWYGDMSIVTCPLGLRLLNHEKIHENKRIGELGLQYKNVFSHLALQKLVHILSSTILLQRVRPYFLLLEGYLNINFSQQKKRSKKWSILVYAVRPRHLGHPQSLYVIN